MRRVDHVEGQRYQFGVVIKFFAYERQYKRMIEVILACVIRVQQFVAIVVLYNWQQSTIRHQH